MTSSAEVYILEDPNSDDYRHVKQMCEKMLMRAGMRYVVHDYGSKPELKDIGTQTHCGALIVVVDGILHIFVEMTRKVRSVQKMGKFEPTIEFFRQRLSNITSDTTIKVLHYTNTDSSTARLIKLLRGGLYL
ncbi:MAG: hypothetical protein RMJ59_02060 [Candidatus Nitrosocaldus sp.]|nr:hypothetical protein [Candidatus Nitrosocaldus sp.]MDW8275151.1 hypothetical protein [Candidatus Nitrosocaldus sp.]